MSNFNARSEQATVFQQKLFDCISKMGFDVALNGTEYTHPHIVRKLRQSCDQTSLAIRFQPDGIICTNFTSNPFTFYVEAKSSKNIEKTAYEQYMKLADANNRVIVVFEHFKWSFNFVDELKLISGEETVGKFKPENRFNVKDGWVYPRISESWWLKTHANPTMSGTPYREVDPSSLIPWEKFQVGINNSLLKQLGVSA